MLNSRTEAEKLAKDIKEAYDKGITNKVIAGKYSPIVVDIPANKSSVKITFKNMYKDTIEPSL